MTNVKGKESNKNKSCLEQCCKIDMTSKLLHRIKSVWINYTFKYDDRTKSWRHTTAMFKWISHTEKRTRPEIKSSVGKIDEGMEETSAYKEFQIKVELHQTDIKRNAIGRPVNARSKYKEILYQVSENVNFVTFLTDRSSLTTYIMWS